MSYIIIGGMRQNFYRSVFGLDISDHSIKFVMLTLSRGRMSLGCLGEKALPIGVLEDGEIKDRELLASILRDLKNTFGIKDVYISLPRDDSALFGSYREVFSNVGLNILDIETQDKALVRTLILPSDFPTLALVDIGRSQTKVFLLENGNTIRKVVIPLGGEAITKNLEKNLEIDFIQAESLKIEVGLSRSTENKEIFSAIIPVVSVIEDEIERAINLSFSQSKKLGGIILCGGQASLFGLSEYLEINLKHPVALGNPWLKVFPRGKVVTNVRFDEALRFATAIGLALRNFSV